MWCDFCRQQPKWRYPVKSDFGTTETKGEDWLACTDCHELIQNHKQPELAGRYLENMGDLIVPTDSGVNMYREVREVHQLFFSNRSGLPRLIEK